MEVLHFMSCVIAMGGSPGTFKDAKPASSVGKLYGGRKMNPKSGLTHVACWERSFQ